MDDARVCTEEEGRGTLDDGVALKCFRPKLGLPSSAVKLIPAKSSKNFKLANASIVNCTISYHNNHSNGARTDQPRRIRNQARGSCAGH